MSDKARSKVMVREYIECRGVLTIYKSLIYFYGMEIGAYLSILIDKEGYWRSIKAHDKKNDFSELPWISLKEIEKSIFISRERNLGLLTRMLELGMLSIIMDDSNEKFFFKLDQLKLDEKFEEYLNILIEEESQNEK